MKSAWWKLLGCVCALAVLDLPVTELSSFGVLAAAVLIILFAPLGQWARNPTSRAIALIALVAVTALIKLALPRPAIEAGQGVYTPSPDGTYERVLPREVFAYLDAAFERRFPRATQCPDPKIRCWLDAIVAPPQGAYAFSSAALVRPAKYSEVVDAIDFDQRGTLPLAALNDLRYNFHPPFAPTRVRLELPFFVVYELPQSLAGGTLCWRGEVFWERTNKSFARLRHPQRSCAALTPANLGRRVFGVEVLPDSPLSMQLELPTALALSSVARQGLGFLAAVLVVLSLSGRPPWRTVVLPLGALAATVVWALILEPLSYTGFRLHAGGSDGLGYEAFARHMAEAAAAGDWYEALKGVEVIYWSMPGLRYFLALMKPVFGDTFFAYLLACAFLPVVIHRILLTLVSSRAAAILTGLYLLTPVFEYFRFTHYIYVKLVVDKGFAETLGYLVFLCALLLALNHLARSSRAAASFVTGARFGVPAVVLIGWCGFVAVAMRPNLAPSVGLLLVVVGLMTLHAKDYSRFALLCLGFAPIGLLSLHNYVYGGEFHFLTMTGAHPDNLEMPPAVYLRAFNQLVTLDFSGEAFQRMLKQLHTWNSPDEFYRVIAFLVVVWVSASRRQPATLRLVAWMALTQQATLFFFHASGRYAFLAWALTFIVVACVVLNRLVPWWRTRSASAAATHLGRA